MKSFLKRLGFYFNPFKTVHLYCCPPEGEGEGDKGKQTLQALENKIKEQDTELKNYKEQLAKVLKEDKKELKPEPDSTDLNNKVKADAEAKAKQEQESKSLESALTFNLTSDKFINENKNFLTKEIGDIFAVAGKEKYESPIDKANATKAAVIQSFFSLQANVDLMTNSQRSTLDDYLKLTKKGREEKAPQVFENIFEPTLEMIKKIKKAEEVSKGKSGAVGGSNIDNDYKDRLINGSRKHFLGEK
jgi:hypothetical protein